REPEWRRLRHPPDAGSAAGELEVQAVDLFEDEPAIHIGHAIVDVAFDAVGVGEPNTRSLAQAALRPHDVEDRIVGAARRREFLIDGRQHADVRAMRVARELHRGDRLHDPTRVDEVLRDLEQLAALEEEGSLLREEERLAWIERELA